MKSREELRQKGQFWTPHWVARAMAAFLLPDKGGTWNVFDPGVGEGALVRASEELAQERSLKLSFSSQDVDAEVSTPLRNGRDASEFKLVIQDYLSTPHPGGFDSIIANPPYIRHHRLTPVQKEIQQSIAKSTIGSALDGRTGYHVFFLLKSLSELKPGGRLAYIVPADTFEGVYAGKLWAWILENFRVHAIATFDSVATPFPGVDTNAVVMFLSNEKPVGEYFWARVHAESREFEAWVTSKFTHKTTAVTTEVRELSKYCLLGLHRAKSISSDDDLIHLGKFIKVVRGIATGANEFFLMTKEEIEAKNLPMSYFVRTLARTRDLDGPVITAESLKKLESVKRPTYLLYLSANNQESDALTRYLTRGEELDLPNRALIKQRKPWYKMERRNPPPFLFAYLGRRNTRFIRNTADIRPLTGFLCVYARDHLTADVNIERLWNLLSDPEVIENLNYVAKTYGSGAIKVEPRALERTPISRALIQKHGLGEFMEFLQDPVHEQLALMS